MASFAFELSLERCLGLKKGTFIPFFNAIFANFLLSVDKTISSKSFAFLIASIVYEIRGFP